MKRFLLISDIHAADIDPAASTAPSYVSTFKSATGTVVDPIEDLERLIDQEKIKLDCILCAGDITNKSEPGPFSYAWKKLHELSASCNVPLITTVGNHDVDSRYKTNSFDPRGFAMSLKPKIPVDNRSHFLEYWAENFCILSSDECNILVLNTAAYHGAGQDAAAEIQHGRISDLTLNEIGNVMRPLPRADVNIVLCHHHVIKPEANDNEFQGQTRGGEKLVQLLGELEGGWIIIHGHKHIPDLYYGPGGSNAPVILGCASFSAQINQDAQNKHPNQVHLLICDPAGAKTAGLTSAGRILSWTWQPGIGWRRAVGLHGLPHFVGFGHRTSVEPLADQLESAIAKSESSLVRWDEAVQAIPSLGRLIPSDFKLLERVLAQKSLSILTDNDGRLAQVGRRP